MQNSKVEKATKFFDIIRIIGGILGGLVSLLFFIFFISIFLGGLSGTSLEPTIPSGNIALLKINGVITTEENGGALFGTELATSEKIVKLLKKIDERKDIKAVILEINSPGGSAVASEEIGNAVKNLNKTNVAVIREYGASGAYWIASATDKIYANRMSFTGSIGVIASHLEYSGLLQDYNVTYRRLVAGKYKDAGTPFKEMTAEEQKLFQKLLDKTHDYFIKEVADNRKLPENKIRELATGFVFLGEEAKELGLIDEIGGREEAIKYLEEQLNVTAELAEIKTKPTLLDALSASFEKGFYFMGVGIGQTLIKAPKYENKMEIWV